MMVAFSKGTERRKEQESMDSGKRSCESDFLVDSQGSFPETKVPLSHLAHTRHYCTGVKVHKSVYGFSLQWRENP